jgi:predicted ribosome quality control (RQC) complex YloA/Tae2 family protein
MHNLYFTLNLLAQRLNKELVGLQIQEAYSQNKDELVLGCSSDTQEFFMKLHLSNTFSCLSFPSDLRRKAINSISLFEEIYGLRIQAVSSVPWDRSFTIQLENAYNILIKMHGRQSNFILFHQKKVLSVFRQQLKGDWEKPLEAYAGKIDKEMAVKAEDALAFRKAIPVLDNELSQIGIEKLQKAGGDKILALDRYLDQLLRPPAFYIRVKAEKVQFRLIQPDPGDRKIEDILVAMNTFASLYLSHNRFSSEKKNLLQSLLKRKKQAQSYITKNSNRLAMLRKEVSPEEIGHILMANLHVLQPHQTETELFDFYRNETLRIALKKELNPQQNAAYYYRKAKNRKIEIATLEENIQKKEEELKLVERQLQELEETENLKDLKAQKKMNPEQATKQESRPFKQFIIDGWHVWVGKSAKANDELTLHYSHKDDLWLHAKDVAGSHVLIKQQSGKKIPQSVLEKAASLAAWYSKNKNESLCAVIYTPKKYVRKVKGFGPGKVRVEREEVLLVPPSDFQTLAAD